MAPGSAAASLRIGLLMHLAPRKRGSFETWVLALCREARRRGHEIHVFGAPPVHPDFAEELGRLGAPWCGVDELLSDPVRAVRRLSSYDVLHLNMVAPRGRLALLAYSAYPARVLFVDRAGGPPAGAAPPQGVRHRVSRLLDRVTPLRLSGLAGVSDFIRDRSADRFRLRSRQVRTIYNGVDTERFRPLNRVRAGPNPFQEFVVATVAHLIPEKGVDYLIRAVAQQSERVRLVIAGDGPESGRLRALGAELRLGRRLEMIGLTNEIPTVLAGADVYAHPSLAEAFGLAIAEAMACGLPVVASRVGGIPELVEDGQTGLLTEPRDVGGLARALDQLASDPALRRRMGALARQRAVERFDVRGCARLHVQWCEQAAHSPALLPPRVEEGDAPPAERRPA